MTDKKTYQSHLVNFKERCTFSSAKALHQERFPWGRQAFWKRIKKNRMEDLKRTIFPFEERRLSCKFANQPVNKNLKEIFDREGRVTTLFGLSVPA